MATLKTQYKNYLKLNPSSDMTYDEWLKTDLKFKVPFISDDFQIGSDGAYEHERIDMKPKLKLKRYCHKTWNKHFKQFDLLPSLYITYNPQGNFIEHGVYSWVMILSINFLIWDMGIQITYDFL